MQNNSTSGEELELTINYRLSRSDTFASRRP